MINNITTVYFTDESEYISSSGPLLKYSEQANIIKQSMVSDDKIIADSFKDSESKPFGTIFNFFVSADWHTMYNECRILLDEYENLSKNLAGRNVPICDGFKAIVDEREIFPYFKAVRFNSLYAAVCYEINHIYFIDSHLSEFEACGKYFTLKTTRARYCADCVKIKEYAKQYVHIDEYKKLYLKNNKAYNARYNRDLSIGDEYHKWQENAKKLLKEAQDGGCTFEEFSKLIALPPSEKKAGCYPKYS